MRSFTKTLLALALLAAIGAVLWWNRRTREQMRQLFDAILAQLAPDQLADSSAPQGAALDPDEMARTTMSALEIGALNETGEAEPAPVSPGIPERDPAQSSAAALQRSQGDGEKKVDTLAVGDDGRTVAQRVLSNLGHEPLLAGVPHLNVNVEGNGVVHLRGVVHDEEQRQVAEDVAASTDGVRDVVNHLTIQRPDEA